jgi:hypothetical protein
MKKIGLAFLLVVAGTRSQAAPAGGQAVPSVDLTDPAGDVMHINGPGNDRDVVKLSLGSDGTSVLVSATISEDEHGDVASSVVELYIDSDNDARTGGAAHWGEEAKPPKQGYEYLGKLSICLAYNENIGACAGGATVPPKSRHERVELDKFKGQPGKEFGFDTTSFVISGVGGPAGAHFTGRVLHGQIPYAKLGAKPGQVLRISPRESAVGGAASFFPDVMLALK